MDAPAAQSTFAVFAQTISLCVAGLSAALGVGAYWQNTRTKRAEFLTKLHQSFFVDPTYRKVRDALDNSSQPYLMRALVSEESSDFTDFLNFFELVAYMQACGTLSSADVEALLGYYLQLLRNNSEVYEYICKGKNGFEHLHKLLTTRIAKR